MEKKIFEIGVYAKGASYSGGFTMDALYITDLEKTDQLTPLKCWIFSTAGVGGNMGVYHTIKVRTWKEV